MSTAPNSMRGEARDPELRAQLVMALTNATAKIARGDGLLLDLYSIQSALDAALKESPTCESY